MKLTKNKIQIGRPCSPSKLVKIEELILTKIKISFGGGIGGANKEIFAEEIISENENEIVVKQFDNKVINISKSFIVYREQIKAILHITDTTQHSNYHEKRVKSSELTKIYELSIDADWEFVDNFIGNQLHAIYSYSNSK